MFDIQLNQKQLQAIIKKTDPGMLKQPLAEFLQDAAALGHSVARHNIAGGTEQAKISIRSNVEPMAAKVYSVMPQARAMSIEEGRPPGQPPALVAVHRWVTGDRYFTQRRLGSLSKEAQARALEVQEAIRQKGAKGKKYIAGAAAAVKRDMPQLVSAVVKKIESGFGK